MSFYQVFDKIGQQQLKCDFLHPSCGDTIQVDIFIKEGNKQRVQISRGNVISQHRSGKNSTFTFRRVFQGIGVERTFFLYSPIIQSVKILRHAKIRRAKLYYLRNLKGKATRLKERFKKGIETLNYLRSFQYFSYVFSLF
jgi:large subunit ribosomal protein L19